MTKCVTLALLFHERNSTAFFSPRALKVVTKSCQTYYLKTLRTHFFLWNILPLSVAILCPTYFPTLITIPHIFFPVPCPRTANCICPLCHLQLIGNRHPECYFEKDPKNTVELRKDFCLRLVKSALWHCSNPPSLSPAEWPFFKPRCSVRMIVLQYNAYHITSLLQSLHLFPTVWQIKSKLFKCCQSCPMIWLQIFFTAAVLLHPPCVWLHYWLCLIH